MRNGEPTWKKRLGVFELPFDILTQISFPTEKQIEELKKDIEVNGLKNPLEINWLLEPTKWGQLRIFKGNQRIEALKRLGWVKAPCYLTIEGYPDNEGLGEIISLLFRSILIVIQK